jgi:succinate dehydrogenase flavin-adding protein (antitoxin of CptAB toxin-antitoxin module)
MEEVASNHAPGDGVSLEFGKVLGQSIAFGAIAGRCSAAQAAAIRQARNDKIHASVGMTWKEFCPRHLKMSRTQADAFINLLEEFGPDYFEHTQSVRISPDTYRLVAPCIKDKALQVGGEALELNSANVQKVAQSMRESRKALMPPAEPAPPEPAVTAPPEERLATLIRHAAETVSQFREVAKVRRDAKQRLVFESRLRGVLIVLCAELKGVGLEIGVM